LRTKRGRSKIEDRNRAGRGGGSQGADEFTAAAALVELESEQSFPASDPPSWPSVRIGEPANHRRTDMSETMYPPSSSEIRRERRELAPEIHAAWDAFSERVFADGALPAKTKQLIAVAVAHVTQCPYCIKGHTRAALRHGATRQEVMEAIWVTAEMRAGAYAHSTVSLTAMDEEQQPPGR
jgi:AhpD family alkylhydroperoxidase